MKNYILFFQIIFCFNVYSQSVSGKILDENKLPLEFVKIKILNTSDSSVVKGAFSFNDGSFSIEGLSIGSYLIQASYVGYVTYRSKLSIGSEPSFLGDIIMKIDKSLELEGVYAVGSLDALKAGIDKKIYSTSDDLTSRGGSALDALGNIPSISVDQDGKISLRGDGNVIILIDGRPSALAMGDGQSLLDALPANSIERIEVVTNPSAKYDPDGTSGIINIVMKKNKLKGFNGIISLTAATDNLYEGSFSLSYRNKRFNTYLNYSFDYYEGYRNFFSDLEREVTKDSSIFLNQDRIGDDLKSGHALVFGTDFYINDRNTLSFSTTGALGLRERYGFLENELYGNDVLTSKWSRESEDPDRHKNGDVNLNYTHKFLDEKGEWSLNATHSFGMHDVSGIYEELYYDNAGVLLDSKKPLNQELYNDETENLTTVQGDWNYIISKIKARVEAGGKVVIAQDGVNTFSQKIDTLTGLFIPDTLSNFDFQFNQNIYSAYGIFGQAVGKFKYQAGLRFEYAQQLPFLKSTNEKYPTEYVNLFPSGHIRYELNEPSEFSLSYSRRINRPRSGQVNPFTSYADPFNLRSGNPLLTPEFINSFDLGYSYTKKKFIASFSVFHRRTVDVINRVKEYRTDNTSIVTYDNIDKSESTGFESIVILKPFHWLKNTFSINGNFINYTNSDPTTDWNNSGFNWSLKNVISADFWNKTASAQLNLAYNAPVTTPQGIVQRRAGVDFAIEKRFLDKKLSVGLKATDIFDVKGFHLDLEQAGVRQESIYKWRTRRVFITVSYKFGNIDSKLKALKSSGGGDGAD